MATTGAVRVHGLRELSRAFKAVSKDLSRELTDELKEAADPVRREAESLAMSEIRNMTEHWATMRIGVAKAQGLVYMVPAARGRRRIRRPNLAGLLMQRAMDPALERQEPEVLDRVDELIGRIARRHDF